MIRELSFSSLIIYRFAKLIDKQKFLKGDRHNAKNS